MSAIVVLPIVLPAVSAAWPALAAAAVAAASAMGFVAGKSQAEADEMTEVDLPVENAEEVAGGLSVGQELVFERDEVRVIFRRETTGGLTVKVVGRNRTDAELREIGAGFTQQLTQRYAYHRLMSQLKERDFNVVDEEVEDDGTVRLQVRTFQGSGKGATDGIA